MADAQKSMSPDTWRKIPSMVRPLIGAPKKHLRMQAKFMEIRNLESEDPVVGLLIKSQGNRKELEAVGAKVGGEVGDIFSVRIPISRLKDLAGISNVSSIQASMMHHTDLDASIPECRADDVHQGNYSTSPPTYSGYTGKGVLVGALDTGIDWNHEDFINDGDGSSRIFYIWDQTITATGDEKPPANFDYGVEYTKAQIDDELNGTTTGAIHTKDDIGHGTHVMGIIAGDGSATGGSLPSHTYVGMAPQADILMVRGANAESGDGGFSDTEELDAICYAAAKADALGKALSFNMSLGGQWGPHDGSALTEQAIDRIVGTGKVITISAGNEGTNATYAEYIHSEGTVSTGTEATVEINIPSYSSYPGAENDVIIVILWYQGNDNNRVTVTSPDGYSWYADTGSDRSGNATSTADGAIYIDNASEGVDPNNGDRECYIQIWDYYSYYPPEDGTWEITVRGNTISESGHFDCWIPYSFLGYDDYAYFAPSSGSNEEIVGSPGVADKAITVAAYSTKTSWIAYNGSNQSYSSASLNDLAFFSCTGPTRDDPGYVTGRQKPEIAGSGFGVISSLSADASDYMTSPYRNQDYVHVLMQGTSMSAPHVAGCVALILQKNPTLTSDEVKQILQNSARSDSYTGSVPNYAWGYGKMDAYAAVQNTPASPQHFVKITPPRKEIGGAKGNTAVCPVLVNNIGQNSDSYNLSVSSNSWTTTLWNSEGTSQITSLSNIPSGSSYKVLVKVAIPSGTGNGAKDSVNVKATSVGNPSQSSTARVVTVCRGNKATLPWSDNFPSSSLNSTKWTYNTGSATSSSSGIGEPSGSYSLNLDGNTSGGDDIRSQPIDLSGSTNVALGYYYQRTGNGESPEAGDDLFVSYYNNAGDWVYLKIYPGSGPDMSSYTYDQVLLPEDACHTNFQIRFHNIATLGDYDDWFIDDVSLFAPPEITVSPDSFNVTLNAGDSTTQTLTIGNIGAGSLEFQISDYPINNNPMVPTIQDVLRANDLHNRRLPPDPVGMDGSNNRIAPFSMTNNLESFDLEATIKRYDTINASDVIKAVVLDGWGTYSSSATSTWDYLNSNHSSYGSQAILIDYTTLDKDNITYQDLVNSGADVLVIPDNWGYYSGEGQHFYLTTSECQAVVQYVNEGHGLYMSSGTFNGNSYVQPQIDNLAGLVGLNSSLSYTWTGSSSATYMSFQNSSHPLAANISGGFTPSSNSTVPTGSNWNSALTDGEIIAISLDNTTAIIAKQNRVYASFMPESSPNTSEYQFIYNAIVFSGSSGGETETNWLSYTPNSGTVSPGSSTNITVKINAKDLESGNQYSRRMALSSNDPENPLLNVPVHLTVTMAPYYVTFDPEEQSSTASSGDTVVYTFTITNLGSNSDSYALTVSGNSWPTEIWNATQTAKISTVGPLAPGGSVDITILVIVPETAADEQTDTGTITATSAGDASVSNFATVITTAGDVLPWFEDFPSTTLDTEKWTVVNGTPSINTEGDGEPSTPYSLELKGGSSSGDAVETKSIDLSGYSNVVLSYYYQNDETETDDDLVVKCYEGSYWVELFRHDGNDSEPAAFLQNQVSIPSFACQSNFKVKFESEANSTADEWFIDDVLISVPPKIEVSPDDFDETVNQGDSETKILTIQNTGGGNLTFNISSQYTGSSELSRIPSSTAFVRDRISSLPVFSPEIAKQRMIEKNNLNKNRPQKSGDSNIGTPSEIQSGNTIYVDVNSTSAIENGSQENPYKTITAGVSNATGGDTIIVVQGIYYEDEIDIDKNLTLRGNGSIVVGQGLESFRVIFNVSSGSANSTIMNFVITNCEWGIFIYSLCDGPINIINNTIYNHSNSGIVVFPDEVITIMNNIIVNSGSFGISYWHGTLNNSYNDVYGQSTNWDECTPGAGSFSLDPLFVNAAGNDFTLQTGSPCIDAGNPSTQYNDRDATRNDMGAFGGPEIGTSSVVSGWLSYDVTSGTIVPGSSQNISVTLDASELSLNTVYHANIVITSNDLDHPEILVPVDMSVGVLPYTFNLSEMNISQNGFPAQTLESSCTLTNSGQNADSYSIDISGNQWPTTIWDESGTNQITQIPSVSPGNSYTFITKVQIPSSVTMGENDTASVQITSAGDNTVQKTLEIVSTTGWSERFETTTLNPSKWTVISGSPVINSNGENEPSPPYSLELNSNATVESNTINLGGFEGQDINLVFWWQNDNTDTGDDLVIKIYDGTYWVEVYGIPGETTEETTYTQHSLQIPGYALNENFKFQFIANCSASSEKWYIDDISIEGTTDVENQISGNLPSTFSLDQNYPNPFNPITTIHYALPKTSAVKIQIFNTQGRLISTLIDGKKPAGRYTIQWNGKDMHGKTTASGVYFYRIVADEFVKVKKLMLLK